MGTSLEDLLHRANKLSNSVVLGSSDKDCSSLRFNVDYSNLGQRVDSSINPIETKTKTTTREEASIFGDVFKKSQALRQTMTMDTDDRVSLLFFSNCHLIVQTNLFGNTSILTGRSLDEKKTKKKKSNESAWTMMRTEREKALSDLVEDSLDRSMRLVEQAHWQRVSQDWQTHKSSLFAAMPSPLNDTSINTSSRGRLEHSSVRPCLMTRQELLFAEKLVQFIDNGKTQNLTKLFLDAVKSLRDEVMTELWTQVMALTETPIEAGQSLVTQRASPTWAKDATRRAIAYLENHFVRHEMELIVGTNSEKARRGGVPGTIALVQAYLNVKVSTEQSVEDGLYEGKHPLWMVVFYCLRCGDARAAQSVLRGCGSAMGDISSALGALINETSLTSELMSTLNLTLKRRAEKSSGGDLFKRAVFSLFAGHDVTVNMPEMAENLENWLWLKLMQCRVTENIHLYGQLQRLVSVTYGEKHFSGSESNLIYFNALWLTGQLESAIEFLARQNRSCLAHAVHIAIVAHQAGLLLVSTDSTGKILTKDSNDSMYHLNLARLILHYTAQFEATNPDEAVYYFSLLNSLPSTENVLHSAIARLLRQTKEYDRILGRWDASGMKRIPGIIGRLQLDVTMIISMVAREAELAGDTQNAVLLFDLAEQPNEAIRLLNHRLSQLAARVGSENMEAETFRDLAVVIANRYRKQSARIDPRLSSTLFLLIDLCTFFELISTRRFEEAIRVMRQLRAIPLSPDQVDGCVAMFHMMPEEVRKLLPEMLLALMRLTTELYAAEQQILTENLGAPQLEEQRQQARAIILYAGMIPYKLPTDINARLIRMEAQLT